MGLLDGIFGDGEADDDPDKYAIIMNAGPENFAAAGNGFQYAVELDDAGYHVELFLDGKASKWPAEFADDPNRPFNHQWRRLRSRDIVAGACGYCANAFDATDAYEESDMDLLSDANSHAPSVGELAAEGYEILTVG